MRRKLLLAVVGAFALVWAGAPIPASAQEYPWCMQPAGRWGPDCAYSTIEQCRATAFGVGFCYQNPRVSGAAQDRPRRPPR